MVDQIVKKKGDVKPATEVQLKQEGPDNLRITGVDTNSNEFTVKGDRNILLNY